MIEIGAAGFSRCDFSIGGRNIILTFSRILECARVKTFCPRTNGVRPDDLEDEFQTLLLITLIIATQALPPPSGTV